MMVINADKSTVYCERERMLGDTAEPVSMSLIEAKTRAALKHKAELAERLLGEDVEIPDVDGIEAEIAGLKESLMERYETFADGKISKDKYIAFRDKNKARTAEMEQKLSLAKGRKEYLTRRKEALEPLAGIVNSEPTREMLLRTVEAVYWDDGDVELKLKADEFLDAYSFEESERLARSVFAEFEANPLGMSIEQRVERILTKEEWERECRECGR